MGNLVNQHVRFIETGEKGSLMTYGKALISRSRAGEIPSID
jgi:hypothetical protein